MQKELPRTKFTWNSRSSLWTKGS